MKKYKKILSLDFELYNSMKYYSVCWIGAAVSDMSMIPADYLDIKVNPDTRHKMVGKELKFPFTYKDLKILPKFDVASRRLLRLIDGDTLVVGHAVDNDVKMLFTSCFHYGMNYPDFDFVDTNAVYGALKGEYAQIGLKTLADGYGIEFNAHDPKEDATATLKALKAMLDEYNTDLETLVESGRLTLGKARGGIVRRCEVSCMTQRAREHIANHNALFDAAQTAERGEGALSGTRVAFDAKLASAQNLFSLAKFAVGIGARITPDFAPSDIVVTSQLIEGDEKRLRLLDFAERFNIPKEATDGLDFYPNKVTKADGEVVSFMQYLKGKYAVANARGERFCFSRRAENLREFEDVAIKLLKKGRRFCAMPDMRCTFVVINIGDAAADNDDLKVRTYNRMKGTGKVRLITFDELKAESEF